MRFVIIKWNQKMVKKQDLGIWICMDVHVQRKTDDIYKNIAEDVETRSGTSSYNRTNSYQEGWLSKLSL